MYPRFVRTSNVELFLAGIDDLEQRGASEACMMLVHGDPGHGKTKTGQHWAYLNKYAYVRIKAAATPHWVLTDIVNELGDSEPARSCEDLFAQAVGTLMERPRPLVIDEVENALSVIKCLETVRDISDLVEVPVILIGRKHVPGRLKRHPQLWSRISAVVPFGPVSKRDIRRCCDELCEVGVDDSVVNIIAEQSEGMIREVVKAIANVERVGKRNKSSAVTAAHVDGIDLTHSGQKAASRRATAPMGAAAKEAA